MAQKTGRSNRWFLIGSYGLLAVVIILMTVLTVCTQNKNNVGEEAFIIGAFSVDGGEWENKDDNTLQNNHFNTVRVRGHLSKMPQPREYLIFQVSNAWLEVFANGSRIADNRRGDDTFLPDTAGNSITYISYDKLPGDGAVEVVLTREPTVIATGGLDDIIMTYVGEKEALHNRLIDRLPLAALCLLLSCSGLFSFAIAGFVMGGVDYRYLSFAAAAFFGGLYLLTDAIYQYLPLLINHPAVCMIADQSVSYAFLAAVLLYVRACFRRSSHRMAAEVMAIIIIALSGAALGLQLADLVTLYQFGFFFDVTFIICCAVLSILLIREAKENEDAKYVLLSWIPIGLAILFVILNAWLKLTDERVPMAIGISLTLLYQIMRLVLALRARYYANLEYEHMQKELYEARVAIMVSQIQPHFLYNSLTSIAMMCTKDPKRARTATINFADYLRGNMNSLKERNPVPFRQELAHLKKYLMLEEMRFGDMLHIEYDIQCDSFLIPRLSVQPLVENAVKHGVGMKEDGGTVTIASYETDDSYKVEVRDDGVGFDPSVPKNDGRSHVGMENVRSRLKEMVNGSVTITSEIGKGTTAVITIPKNGETN